MVTEVSLRESQAQEKNSTENIKDQMKGIEERKLYLIDKKNLCKR